MICDSSPQYLYRQVCPSCFSPSENAQLKIRSKPAAEEISFGQQGEFLSGYSQQRVFFSYYRCSTCALLYCPVYFTQDQLNTLYQNQPENMSEAPFIARFKTQKAYYDLLKKYHNPEGDYLEIGADIGLFTKFFAENHLLKKFYIYEPNVDVHTTLKKNLGNKTHQIMTKNYVSSDIESGTLSIAVIIHALDHILKPRQLMKDIYQNLRPGGVAFIVTHDESSLLARLLKKKWPPFTLQHPHLFRPSTMRSLLETEGFKVLASKKTANYFPLTYFIKAGLMALGLNKISIPNLNRLIIPIKLGNIATIAQKPLN